MHAIPVGLESKEFDFELIKSKIENKMNPTDRNRINFLNDIDLIM
jgi:hypothetical protein